VPGVFLAGDGFFVCVVLGLLRCSFSAWCSAGIKKIKKGGLNPPKKVKKSNIQGQLDLGLRPVLEQRGFWALWFVWILAVCNAGLLVSRNYSVFAARFGLDFLVSRPCASRLQSSLYISSKQTA